MADDGSAGKVRDGGQGLAARFVRFAVGIIGLVHKLPRTYVGRHVGGQLLRAGTSAGANYEEARGAESRADFIHKMGIVLKELKESRYWLQVMGEAELLPSPVVTPWLTECQELCAIVAKSILTAKSNR